MRVRDLVEQLTARYDGETELIVAWWDKATVEGYGEMDENSLTEDEWGEVVDRYENREFWWQSEAATTLTELCDEVVADLN